MKALVKAEHEFGNLKIQDVPEPKPGKGQVKIEVKYAEFVALTSIPMKGITK